MTKQFDLIVIGAGAAGLTAGFTAAGLGKKVLMIDANLPGGECTWSGCIPSKALINQANEVHAARKFGNPEFNGADIMAEVRQVSERVYQHETPEVLEKAGITFVQGRARFIDTDHVEADGQRFRGRKFVIATGSRPAIPPVPGIDQISVLTNESVFQLTELPESLAILGAGPIGVELSQAFNRLGVKVTLLEMAPRILIREEAEFSEAVANTIEAEGVVIKTGIQISRISPIQDDGQNSGVRISLEKDTRMEELHVEQLLVAAGRAPNVESLNLSVLGLPEQGYVPVNDHLQTKHKHIYACGDVAGPMLLSHMANYQAKLATLNALFPIRRKANYQHASWVTFCQPELASAGMTEEAARQQHADVRVYHYDLNKLDRGQTKAGDSGKIKIVTDRKGRILGAHILAERAGEMIAQVQTIKTLGIPLSRLQKVIHPYPIWSDALRQLGQQVMIDNIKQHPLVRLFRK